MCKAVLYPTSGPPIRVFVSNISMTGIGLRCTTPLMTGGRYRVTVEAGPLTLRSGMQVVRCVRHDARSWEVGARLDAGDLAAHRRECAPAKVAPSRLKESVPRNPTQMLGVR